MANDRGLLFSKIKPLILFFTKFALFAASEIMIGLLHNIATIQDNYICSSQDEMYTSVYCSGPFELSGSGNYIETETTHDLNCEGEIDYSNCSEGICEDGTYPGDCSITKPEFCDRGQLINNCRYCGCPIGRTCYSDGVCGIVGGSVEPDLPPSSD